MSAAVAVLIRRISATGDGGTGPSGLVTPFEVVFEVRGEADVASAAALRQELAWALSVAGARLVFDVSGLTFCALAGLDALLAAETSALAQGRSVRWSGQSPTLAWLRSTCPPARGSAPALPSGQAPELAGRGSARGIAGVVSA